MRELNLEFQDQYKRLDKLCREMYSFGEGVSAYIKDMENTPYNEQNAVNNWDNIYKMLKHVRWMRNQLAHDISIDSDFCEQSDIDWVKSFYNSILNGNDPLTRAYKMKQAAIQKYPTASRTPNENKTLQLDASAQKPHTTLWRKIISKIKSWFS